MKYKTAVFTVAVRLGTRARTPNQLDITKAICKGLPKVKDCYVAADFSALDDCPFPLREAADWCDYTGHCGNCTKCDGLDEERDVSICRVNNPHRDWRYRNNEPCPEWEHNGY